jgi:regulator of sigma E protease
MGSTLTAILAIGVLIIIHEMGHFFVARWSGMKVLKFSVGFGPPIARVKKGDTEYQIGILPLGGFVQIEGMNPHDGSDPKSATSYSNRPAHLRFATIFAGPAANYLLGFLMMFLFFAFFASVPLAPVRVISVIEDSPAMRAGLQKDDLIVGTATQTFDLLTELRDAVQAGGETGLELRIKRAGEEKRIRLVPDKVAGGYQIGIELEATGRRVLPLGVAEGARASLAEIEATTVGTLRLLAMLVQGKGFGQLRGPIGMVENVSRAAEQSWADAFAYLGKISIALGFFNLLPIPALDGSRLLFLILGVIRRKPLNTKVETAVHVVGFLLLLALIIAISIGDVAR